MSTSLGRRLGRLEALAQEEARRRFTTAFSALAASMAPEHRGSVHGWLVGHEVVGKRCVFAHRSDRFCLRCIEEEEPPALVRAVWVMLFEHVEREIPVALPPEVAGVYVEHPGAVPSWPCPGCAYLLPALSGRLAYAGACPVCGHNTHSEEEATL